MAESNKKISIILDLAGNFLSEIKTAALGVQKFKSTLGKSKTDFRLEIDASIANMKMNELKRLYDSLKIQMAQKLKFEVEEASIEKTATSMDAVRDRIKNIGTEGKASASVVGSAFTKMGAALVAAFSIKATAGFIWDSVKAAAELKDIRASFQGTTRDIDSMRKATADMVDDGDLMKLSNHASALGVKLKDQPVLFLLASNAGKKMGRDVEAGFEAIINTTEGLSRGLKQLGIERVKYNQEVERLAKLEGGKLNDLEAEAQKRIKIQAILNLTNLTMDDVNNNQATMNQQIKSLPALVKDVKEELGGLFDPLLKAWLPPTIEFLKDLARRIKELSIGRGGVAAEGVEYDFSGTSEKEREDLILDWQIKAATAASKINKARADFLSYDMTYDAFQSIVLENEIAISTYYKLIGLARQYKGESTTDDLGGLTEEAIKKRMQDELELYKLRYELNLMTAWDYENYLRRRLDAAKKGTAEELKLYKELQDELSGLLKTFRPEIKEDFNFASEVQEKLFKKIKDEFERQGVPWDNNAKAFALRVTTTTETEGSRFGAGKPVSEGESPLKKMKFDLGGKEFDGMRLKAQLLENAAVTAADAIIGAFTGVKVTLKEILLDLGAMSLKLLAMAGIKYGLSEAFPMLAPFFHTGGVVGMPMQYGFVNPAAFTGAKRYHSGKDVPAILQSDEVVYTGAQHKTLMSALLTSRSVMQNNGAKNVFVFKNLLDGQKFIQENMNKHRARIR